MIKEFFIAEDEIFWREKKNIWMNAHEKEELHDYTIDNLYSTASDELKNHSTKSMILAPNNSTEDDETMLEGDNFINLILSHETVPLAIKPNCFKFNKKAKRADIHYERDHNSIIDNGVVKKGADEEDVAEFVGYVRQDQNFEMQTKLMHAHAMMDNIASFRSGDKQIILKDDVSPTKKEYNFDPEREKYKIENIKLDEYNA